MPRFDERLADAVRRRGNPVCLGIDPRWDSLPKAIRDRHDPDAPDGVAHAYEVFGLRVLELIGDRVPVVKPQAAFFEACGPEGFHAMRAILRRCREMNTVTILDAKRGDIASTAAAYSDAAFRVWGADSVTVNPYLGEDAVEPFIAAARKCDGGIFVLVRTSNPGGGLFQNLDCGGVPLYRRVAHAVAAWNAQGEVGAVVGATHPRELVELRAAMPDVWFLIPGYGAQGGTAEDVKLGFRADGMGAVVNSSRGLTFPFAPDDAGWEAKVIRAAETMIAALKD